MLIRIWFIFILGILFVRTLRTLILTFRLYTLVIRLLLFIYYNAKFMIFMIILMFFMMFCCVGYFIKFGKIRCFINVAGLIIIIVNL